MKAILFSALLLTFSALPASAQSLRLPTLVFAAGAAADWSATIAVRHNPYLHESNPLLKGLDAHHQALMVLTGASIDAAGVLAWNRLVGRHHPKLAALGLYAGAAGRIWLAQRNLHFDHRFPYDPPRHSGVPFVFIAPD